MCLIRHIETIKINKRLKVIAIVQLKRQITTLKQQTVVILTIIRIWIQIHQSFLPIQINLNNKIFIYLWLELVVIILAQLLAIQIMEIFHIKQWFNKTYSKIKSSIATAITTL